MSLQLEAPSTQNAGILVNIAALQSLALGPAADMVMLAWIGLDWHCKAIRAYLQLLKTCTLKVNGASL